MQDRLTYASGNTLTTEGFRCSIGEPIDIIVDENTPFGYNAGIDVSKQLLVTLEVDGDVVCYRELHDFEIVNEDENAIVVGDYTINIDANELTGEYTSARIRLEPIELTVSDAFRAAVGKVAPKSEGGSGGDGAVEIPTTYSNGTRTLGMTYNECLQLKNAYICYHTYDGNNNYTSTTVCYLTYVGEKKGLYIVCFVVTDGSSEVGEYIFYADTPDGYATADE